MEDHMAKNKNNPLWAEAKKKCRLNAATIQMAKELGMSPKSLLKNIPGKNDQWKTPVKVWIQDLYEEKFGVEKFEELLKKYNNTRSNMDF